MEFAFIFDFDGVLADTMEAHFFAYSQALKEVGVPIDREVFFRMAGVTGRESAAHFCKVANKDVDIEKVYMRKGEIFKQVNDKSTPIACNLALLKMLRAQKTPVAIASGSSRPSIMPVIEKFGIEFDALISSEDVTRGKPHPDLFLTAAQRLGVPPENCIVVEDSETGIEAARNAGMRSFRFYNIISTPLKGE